jgi:hypothetical protein
LKDKRDKSDSGLDFKTRETTIWAMAQLDKKPKFNISSYKTLYEFAFRLWAGL